MVPRLEGSNYVRPLEAESLGMLGVMTAGRTCDPPAREHALKMTSEKTAIMEKKKIMIMTFFFRSLLNNTEKMPLLLINCLLHVHGYNSQ